MQGNVNGLELCVLDRMSDYVVARNEIDHDLAFPGKYRLYFGQLGKLLR